MINRLPGGMWRIHTVLMATVAFLVLSACSNITNSDPADISNPRTDPKTLTTEPSVALPGGYTGTGVVEIQSGSLSAPERIEDHFVPIGPVWDVTVDGLDHVDFGDDVAVLRFAYDPVSLSGAGVLEEFVVFVFNETDAGWERLKESGPVQEAGNHYIQAETTHFSSFVATAAVPSGSSVTPAPGMDDLFPDGIAGSGQAAFSLIDESFSYYIDRDYYLVPPGDGPGESAENGRTFSDLGLDGSVGISTYNGGSTEHPFAAHKHYTGANYIVFDAHINLDVYVMYDSRGGAGPEDTSQDAGWLESVGFEAIGDGGGNPYFVETTDPVGLYRVYRRSYLAGETVTLHGNWNDGGDPQGSTDPQIQTNYWVVLKPQGSTDSDTGNVVSQAIPLNDVMLPDGPIALDWAADWQGRSISVSFGPPDATNTSVTWSSDDDFVVRVSSISPHDTATLIPVAEGAATITVTAAEGGLSDSVVVQVPPPPDADGDGVPDMHEDAAGDVDGDGVPGYLDTDDDGDGVLTANEDFDVPGLPLYNDTDADGLPNFLDMDDDGDGIATRFEDLNANGDPRDDDFDSDGIPDYLDFDSPSLPVIALAAEDGQSGDLFGDAVATDGDYVAIGAPLGNASSTETGAVYVFRGHGVNHWDSGVKLVPPDGADNDRFGRAVDIHEDYLIVGASNKNSPTLHEGAAYVFRRTGANEWDSGVRLVDPSPRTQGFFGNSVAISGDYAVVGSWGPGSNNEGEIYVFRRTGANSWGSPFRITSPEATIRDWFGFRVAIDGDLLVATAVMAEGAYVFRRTGTNSWSSDGILEPPEAGVPAFGKDVSISGDYVVVGAGYSDGAAYVFHRSPTGDWDTGTKLPLPPDVSNNYFGDSVAISGDRIAVGADYPWNVQGSYPGAAYLFERTGLNSWDFDMVLPHPNKSFQDHLGDTVAVDGSRLIVGAYGARLGLGSAFAFELD